MTDVQKKREVKNTNGVNPIVAGIAGAVVGGVAVATSMVMSNKKNRDKIKAGLASAKDKTVEYLDEVKKQASDRKSEVKEKVIQEVKKL
ncbi:MAG: hypothetical protein WC841_05550 [Candidatus Shapirobacteria bacterium]|jgi:gas vesicle protein